MSLEKINTGLEQIYTSLSDLRGVQTNALTKQTAISEIVTTENNRLKEKQKTIDAAIENQKRIIYFNDNSRKIYSAYLVLILTATITLGIVYLIRVIHINTGEYIPEVIFNILFIATISTGLLILWRVYFNIRARDNYNFDELKLTAPHIAEPSSTSSGSGLGGAIMGCIGPQCCTLATEETPGTKWDAGLGKCVFSAALNDIRLPEESMDMLPSTLPEEGGEVPQGTPGVELFSNGVASPNEAFEYTQYAPAKR